MPRRGPSGTDGAEITATAGHALSAAGGPTHLTTTEGRVARLVELTTALADRMEALNATTLTAATCRAGRRRLYAPTADRLVRTRRPQLDHVGVRPTDATSYQAPPPGY